VGTTFIIRNPGSLRRLFSLPIEALNALFIATAAVTAYPDGVRKQAHVFDVTR